MIKKVKKEQLLMGVLFGILLLVIAIPVPKEQEDNQKKQKVAVEAENEGENKGEEKRLKDILGKISGVGNVEIYITYRDEGKLVVEKDETISEEQIEETDHSGGIRKTTMIQQEQKTIFGEDEIPYIVQKLSPSVEGVLVVAEGGGNEAIKKQIENTIKALFGLEAHKISIMKMEVSK